MIVDANIFKGYFDAQMGNAHALHGCPLTVMRQATSTTPIFHDVGQIVENEWRALVDQDWFDPWLADQLQSGSIAYIEPVRDNGVEKNLASLGFPKSRDIVYVRLGLGVVQKKKSSCKFFTEDLDFYDPKKKGCSSKTRTSILSGSKGPVAKLLKKKEIHVSCS